MSKLSPISRLCARSICRLGLFLALAFHTSAIAEVVFSESFESPVVSGFDDNTVPDNSNWIGSNGAYNSTVRGLYNETVAWPDTPPFTTPYGEQGYSLQYSTTMLTTAQGATGQTITAGETYTLTFNAAAVDGTTADYRVELVAFDVEDDNASRENPNSPAGTIVASASGPINTSDMSFSDSIVFAPDGANAHLGKELGIRIDNANGDEIYDNIRLIVGHDYAPNPASGENLSAGGNVMLSWTNMPPVAPATETYVDILFGTDPGALSLEVDGQLTSSAVVNAPQAGTYYWQIDSYPDGDPAGTPVSSNVYSFTIADTDGDGLPDDYELANTDPPSNTALDPASDLDSDGLTAAEEYNFGTDPNNPDSDGDGLLDGEEINGTAGDRPATNPLLADTDGDGLSDSVETNTGIWVGPNDTGTNPADADWDKDGLVDGVETNDGNYIDQSATGSSPYNPDTDADNVTDWYEVTAAFTDPNNAAEKPPLPYPLPDPDSSTGATDKPVKVYIMSGQSNMVGMGTINGDGDDTLETMIKRQNKFPNLVNDLGEWTVRQDVRYRGVISDVANVLLSPGALGTGMGPEVGFGYVMGWYHDEPVLLLKSCTGNRGLGWDILPPGTPSWEYEGTVFAGYGESPDKRAPGDPLATDPGWWAGLEWDRFFTDESEWVRPQEAVTNVVDVLDNFAAEYPDWAAQGFEIAGFVWWQGDKDRYDMGYATQYEANLVKLIDTLRGYYSNRYPGQVAPNAPFVLATLGQTAADDISPEADVAIYNAQMAVDGDSGNYPLYAGNVKTVYSHPLSQGGASNSHYNKNAVTYMLVGDALGVAMVELLETETPPTPNPNTFEIAPSGTSTTTIGMVATEASSANGPVEYYFENTTNSDFRDWSTDRTWTNSGLTAGATYSYRVKTRDSNGLEGEWSATSDGTAAADTSAPSPDPMTFEVAPTTQGEDSISMTATTAVDINGVEYYFTCTVGGGADSGWQAGPTYTPTGLAHSTEYSYTVKAKDGLGNETAASAPASATTDTPDLIAPTPDPMTFETAPTAQGENSISMTASTATDDSGVEYYFEETSGNPGGSDSGWQDGTDYTDTGLDADTQYTYVVRARDKSPAQNVTGDSAAASATTDAPDLTAPSVSVYNPLDEASDVPIETDLIVTFDEDIAVGSGLITIKNLTDSSEITLDVTDGNLVSISGAVLTITPDSNLIYAKDYAVQIAATAVTDLVGNAFAGIADDTTWNFTTEDAPPPGLVFFDDFEVESGSPDVDAAGSLDNTSGQINTSKWVRNSNGFGSGRQGIVDESAGQFTDPVGEQAYAFRYTNSGITSVEGAIGALTAGITYTITFDVVMDGHNDGTPYNAALVTFNGGARNEMNSGGISRNTTAVLATVSGNASTDGNYSKVTLSYTTGDTDDTAVIGQDVALRFLGATTTANIDNVEVVTTSGPDETAPTVSSLNPLDDTTDVAVDTDLVVTFGENIAAGSGNIILKNLTDVSESTIDVTDGTQVSISGAQLTINPNSDLLNGKGYAIRIAATAIEDLAGNAFAGISDDTSWNFTTVAEVTNNFSSWISGYDVGGLTGPNDDADGDGVSNAAENYFGTNPSLSSAGLSAKAVAINGDTTFTFSHPINDTSAADITAAYQWSTDLATFHGDGVAANGTTVTFTVGTPVAGEVTVTATITGTKPDKVFVTVDVTQNP